MKGKYQGPMTVDEFFQALFQDRHAFFDKHASDARIKQATIYVTFCDEYGETVQLRDSFGQPIEGYISAGAYKCAADQYDDLDIDPKPLPPQTKTKTKTVARPSSAAPFAPF